MSTVTCAGCGHKLPDGNHDTALPCPECGSVARIFEASVSEAAFAFDGTAVVSFSTYPQQLIALAERLLNEQEFSISVVVAHVAAEVAASRKLTEAFGARGISDIEDVVTGFFSGSSMANERTRKLYSALTCDNIASQPFWSDFKLSATLRNHIAHKGATASQGEAEMAIRVSSAMIKHLGKWGSRA